MGEWLTWLETTSAIEWVRSSPSLWAYPSVLLGHTVGLAVLVGFNAVLDLRVLGAAPTVPLAGLTRTFPAMWAGFVLSVATGVVLLLLDTERLWHRPFLVKIALVASAVSALVLLQRTLYGRGLHAAVATPWAKTLAVLSLGLWCAAIVAGRALVPR